MRWQDMQLLGLARRFRILDYGFKMTHLVPITDDIQGTTGIRPVTSGNLTPYLEYFCDTAQELPLFYQTINSQQQNADVFAGQIQNLVQAHWRHQNNYNNRTAVSSRVDGFKLYQPVLGINYTVPEVTGVITVRAMIDTLVGSSIRGFQTINGMVVDNLFDPMNSTNYRTLSATETLVHRHKAVGFWQTALAPFDAHWNNNTIFGSNDDHNELAAHAGKPFSFGYTQYEGPRRKEVGTFSINNRLEGKNIQSEGGELEGYSAVWENIAANTIQNNPINLIEYNTAGQHPVCLIRPAPIVNVTGGKEQVGFQALITCFSTVEIELDQVSNFPRFYAVNAVDGMDTHANLTVQGFGGYNGSLNVVNSNHFCRPDIGEETDQRIFLY